jgi:DNA mismatch endonuclease, patch repair protein
MSWKKGHKTWNKGIPHSLETRKKISIAKKGCISVRKGVKLTDETKLKLSLAKKGKPNPKISAALKGRHLSDSMKLKLSKALKGKTLGRIHTLESRNKMRKAAIGKLSPMQGKHHSELTKQKLRNARLLQIVPLKGSSIELKVRSQLIDIGIGFKSNFPIIGQPDIFIPALNLLLFIDGCYWHGCHECKLTLNKKSPQINAINKNYYRDFRIKQELELEGYRVVRLWEHDINSPEFNIGRYL